MSLNIQQQKCTHKLDEREVIACGLLVAGGYGAEALDAMNEALDMISERVQLAVEPPLALASRIAVDHRLHPACTDRIDDAVRVVARVGDERTTARVRDQFLSHHRVVQLTWGQRDVDRPTLRVDEGVEFG